MGFLLSLFGFQQGPETENLALGALDGYGADGAHDIGPSLYLDRKGFAYQLLGALGCIDNNYNKSKFEKGRLDEVRALTFYIPKKEKPVKPIKQIPDEQTTN